MNAKPFTRQEITLRVCVDSISEGGISGRLLGQRLASVENFSDLGSLLLILDRHLSRTGYPQAFQRARSFAQSVENIYEIGRAHV